MSQIATIYRVVFIDGTDVECVAFGYEEVGGNYVFLLSPDEERRTIGKDKVKEIIVEGISPTLL